MTIMRDLACPKCGGRMRSFERSRLMVEQCEVCRGFFLDLGELERLIDAEGGGWSGRVEPPADVADVPLRPPGRRRPGAVSKLSPKTDPPKESMSDPSTGPRPGSQDPLPRAGCRHEFCRCDIASHFPEDV